MFCPTSLGEDFEQIMPITTQSPGTSGGSKSGDLTDFKRCGRRKTVFGERWRERVTWVIRRRERCRPEKESKPPSSVELGSPDGFEVVVKGSAMPFGAAEDEGNGGLGR